MHCRHFLTADAIGLASIACAESTRQCPTSDICFSLTVPDINMPSRAGDYYVQIQANTTYSWIGLAQGDKMAGAHFVVVYKSADSKNTTISPRLAGNHEILTYDNSTQVTRLSHSSIHDGQITANIKCSNCNTWASDSVNLTTPTMNWIWAHSTGSLLNTDDKAIPIPKHDRYGTIIFKANAHGGPDSNPWTTQLPGPKLPSGSSGELPLARSGPPAHVVRMYAAHSILACLAWAGIYPIGGIMIRLFSFPNLLWIHAGLQIFGVCLYTAAVGLGIQLSINARFHRMRNKHVVIGLIIFVFVFLQNFLGFLHHYYFKKNANRHVFSYIHLWTGRLCFTLGIINAGFGFQITHKTLANWEVKTYIVFAVLIWVLYIFGIVVGELSRKKVAAERAKALSSSSGTDGGQVALETKKVSAATEEQVAHQLNKDMFV